MTREKIGKIAHDLLVKDFQTEDSYKPNVLEQTEEMQKDYIKHLTDAARHALGQIKCSNFTACKNKICEPLTGDFFIEVLSKKEKIMENVIRSWFIPRRSCPTPNYDQILYKYNSTLERIEEVWVIPSRETCFYFMQNTKQVKPEMFQLLDYVKRFADGELFRLAKEYNGEKEDSPELEKKTSVTVN